jgi:hypothetical protein
MIQMFLLEVLGARACMSMQTLADRATLRILSTFTLRSLLTLTSSLFLVYNAPFSPTVYR